MKFIVATSDYSGLGLAMRLEEEGHRAMLAVQPPAPGTDAASFHRVGNSVVEKCPLADVLEARDGLRDWFWIWDGNHSVRENELLRSEGCSVFGGGIFPDLMEHDREFALRYCESYGLKAPESRRFSDTRRAIAFLERQRDRAFVFKPDRGRSDETWVPDEIDPAEANFKLRSRLENREVGGPFILQEKKYGTEANVEVWFVEGQPKFALMLVECKRRLNGERGEMTGCSLDFAFPISLGSKAVRETVGKLFPGYRRMRYTGFGDANVIIDGEGFWLLEKCDRLGYNAHPNVFWNLNRDELGRTLAGLAAGTYEPNFLEAFGASVTVFNEGNRGGEVLTIPNEISSSTYLWDVYKENGQWMTVGYDNSLLMVASSGATPASAWNHLMDKTHRLQCASIAFRTDGADTGYRNNPLERLAALEEMELI